MSATPGEERRRWAVPDANALVWRVWDDEFLVYNSASGQTHHLNLLAGEALRSLEAEPARPQELICRLAGQFGVSADRRPRMMVDGSTCKCKRRTRTCIGW